MKTLEAEDESRAPPCKYAWYKKCALRNDLIIALTETESAQFLAIDSKVCLDTEANEGGYNGTAP